MEAPTPTVTVAEVFHAIAALHVWTDDELQAWANESLAEDLVERWKTDQRTAIWIVEFSGRYLEKVHIWQHDSGVVSAAVAQNGRALEHASEELRADFAIVEVAVKQCGMALQYAHESFKQHRGIARAAIKHYGWQAAQHVSPTLRDDEDFVMEAVQVDARCFEVASRRLHLSPEFLLKVVQRKPEAFKYASEDTSKTADICLEAMQTHESPELFTHHVPESMMSSSPEEYVRVAVAAIANALTSDGVLSILQHISKGKGTGKGKKGKGKGKGKGANKLNQLLQDDEIVLPFLSLQQEEQRQIRGWRPAPATLARHQLAADATHVGDLRQYALDALRPFVVFLGCIRFADMEPQGTYVEASGSGIGAQNTFEFCVANDVGELADQVAAHFHVAANKLKLISPAGYMYSLGEQLI